VPASTKRTDGCNLPSSLKHSPQEQLEEVGEWIDWVSLELATVRAELERVTAEKHYWVLKCAHLADAALVDAARDRFPLL